MPAELRMTEMLNPEVAVIGAGTAGLTAFHEVRRAGREALLIDHGPLGTTCARVGCMPSKAVLHAAHKWSILRELAGAQPAVASVTADDLWREALAMRDTLAEGAAKRTRQGAGDQLLMATARFVGPGELDVGGRRVRAKAVVVATGSRPVVPDFLQALGDCVLTTDTLFHREKLPRSIGIIGTGAVGLEMAVALSRLGVRVVAADLRSAPGGIVDPAIAERAAHRFRDDFTLWLGEPVQVLAGPLPGRRSVELARQNWWKLCWLRSDGNPIWTHWTCRRREPRRTQRAASPPTKRRCACRARPSSSLATCIRAER